MRRLLLGAMLALLMMITPGIAVAKPAPGSVIPKGTFLSAMTGGNIVDSPLREEKPRADGYRHIDTPAMIKRLQGLNVNTFTYGVWDQHTDWQDLVEEFAPAAQRAGIKIMVYIVPPSECFLNDVTHLDGRCSRPFNKDYRAWGKAIAELSVTYDNVVSWGIDDFLVGDNSQLFTKAYLDSIRAIMDGINPGLKWYVTMYHWDITPAHMATIKDALDGVIYAYNGYLNNTVDPTWLEPRVDAALQVTGDANLELVLLIYNGRFLDGIIYPDDRYATAMLKRAEPYLADGRLTGVIAYGTPLQLEQQAPSWDSWAHGGMGRLSLSVSNFTATKDGSWAAAEQRISVPGDDQPRKLTFHHHDQDEAGLPGYQYKQLLVDGEVVWQTDITADPRMEWLKTTVDLTEALRGKTQATLSFRLFHAKGVGWWPADVAIDDLSAEGFTIKGGDFESETGWTLDRNEPTMQPYIELYTPDRWTTTFNAISEGFARLQGREFRPVSYNSWPNLRIGRDNRAMYGNGRLQFSTPKNTPIPANTCATATQTATVLPGLGRYEISFWHTDWYQANFGNLFKQLRIDGKIIWDRDAGDYWPWFYINGSDHQGVIDLTDLVKGKQQVEIEFAVCSKAAIAKYQTEIGFDHIETIGLDLANGELENTSGWKLASTAPITAAFDLHGPCQVDDDARVITGKHRGSLVIKDRVCLDRAEVTGSVVIKEGGSLEATGSVITGSLSAAGAVSIRLAGTKVGGAVSITGSTGELSLEHSRFGGAVSLTGNHTDAWRTVFRSSEVGGALACRDNQPRPTDLGFSNRVRGPVSGLC
ncbi:hypothetical protein [Microlunatus parietis]|uniref:Uncharacterized protein n=1 Tax=Microlunatus parietis TaxID=682979 RepID=A0A7Y9LCF0_9ACTN|nr:hypothetical protein [Microlunatus parietis]NYE71773.1 hypothetical protein [Microlunatus parietis]